MINLRVLKIVFCLLFITGTLLANRRQPRPVYIFAHRANDLDDIEDAIENGANAIELDLQLCNRNSEWKVHHDDCSGSVTFNEWLDHFNNQAERGKIVAIDIDIKADAENVSRERIMSLVSSVRSKLSSDILIIYSVGDWDKRGILDHFMRSLQANEGVTIDMSTSASPFAQEKIDFFKDANVINQVYADGILALIPTTLGIILNIETATRNRDGANDVKFVYSWTYESEESIEHMLLNKGCNGLLVNDCDIFCIEHSFFTDDGLENALDVIRKNSLDIRLATRDDLDRWNFVSTIEPLLSGEWIQLENRESQKLIKGALGDSRFGVATGSMPNLASEAAGFIWRMEKELFSMEQDQIQYGDVVYLRNWNYPFYLTGARGASPADVVGTASGLVSNINSKIKHYQWRVKKSLNETGSGPVNLGDPIYLETFGKHLREAAGSLSTPSSTAFSTNTYQWTAIAPEITPRIPNGLRTNSGFFLKNVASGERLLLSGDNRMFTGASRNETRVSLTGRPGLFLERPTEFHWFLEQERGSSEFEAAFYGDVIYLKNGLPDGDGPAYLTGTRGGTGEGVINVGLVPNMASKEKHYQWVIKRSPDQTGDGIIRTEDPIFLASFGDNYLMRTDTGIKTMPYDPARRNDFLWQFEEAFIRIP